MSFLRKLLSRSGPEQPAVPPPPATSLKQLLEEYKAERTILNFLGRGEERFDSKLKDVESQLIATLSGFQQEVFRILAKHGFDISSFLEGGDWTEEIRTVYKDICRFLYYGAPWPTERCLPITGEEVFLWLLSQAYAGEKDCLGNISAVVAACIKKGEILGRKFDNQAIDLAMRIIVVFVGDRRTQSAAIFKYLSPARRPGLPEESCCS